MVWDLHGPLDNKQGSHLGKHRGNVCLKTSPHCQRALAYIKVSHGAIYLSKARETRELHCMVLTRVGRRSIGLAWLGFAWRGLAWFWLELAWLILAWLGLAWLGLSWLGLA